MIDPFGRAIACLRVSATGRCDFRCMYCTAEDMTFLLKRDLLTLGELDRLCAAFIRLGTTKIRIASRRTVGPARRDAAVRPVRRTAGERAGRTDCHHQRLPVDEARRDARGGRRENVPLDTLDPVKFTGLTLRGQVQPD